MTLFTVEITDKCGRVVAGRKSSCVLDLEEKSDGKGDHDNLEAGDTIKILRVGL